MVCSVQIKFCNGFKHKRASKWLQTTRMFVLCKQRLTDIRMLRHSQKRRVHKIVICFLKYDDLLCTIKLAYSIINVITPVSLGTTYVVITVDSYHLQKTPLEKTFDT